MIFDKENSKVLVISHFLINPIKNNSALSTMIANYLKGKVKTVVQIEHPFPESKDKNSFVLKFVDGKQVKSSKFPSIKFAALGYIWDFLSTYYYLLTTNLFYKLCIACDPLSAFCLMPMRRLGIIRRMIYYSVDYVETRFSNKVINAIYHFIDRAVCRSSDEVWVVAKEQEEARYKNGLYKPYSAPFRVVPIGFDGSTIEKLPLAKINKNKILFMGAIRESAGPQLAIEALPFIKKNIPNVHLTILGNGDYKEALIELAKKLDVTKSISFVAGVESHDEMVSIITKHSVGLAPYAPVNVSISYNSDPGKIKLYLLCGLPVVTTGIATSGKLVAKAHAGVVSEFDPKKFAEAVVKVIKSDSVYKNYRESAIKLGQKYDITNILNNAFGEYQ